MEECFSISLFLQIQRYEPFEGSVPTSKVQQSMDNSLWSAGHLNKAPICYPETAVSIYQDTPSQHPRKWTVSFTRWRNSETPSRNSLSLCGSFCMFKLIKAKIIMDYMSHRKQTAIPCRYRPCKAVK